MKKHELIPITRIRRASAVYVGAVVIKHMTVALTDIAEAIIRTGFFF